jgi:ABC-type bacteriocin/lantibiotic exporter with double-glycine peptidase domain
MITPNNSVLSRFYALIRPDHKEIRNIYIFAIFSGLMSLGLPLGIQMIINFIQLGQISTSWFVLVALVVSAIGFSGVLNIYQLRITENLQQRIFTRSAFDFADRIPKIKMVELVKRYAPELTNRFFDTLTLQKGLSKLLIDMTSAVLQIIFGLVLLSFYHSFFIFIGFFLLILLYFMLRFTVKKGFASSLNESTYKYKITHWLEEIAHSRISFKMAGESKLHITKTNSFLHNYLDARNTHFKILVQQYVFLIVFKVAIALTLLIAGGLLVINGQINIGQFVAAEIIILLVLSSVEKLILNIEIIYDVLTAVEKIGQVTDLTLEKYTGNDLQNDQSRGIHVICKELTYMPEQFPSQVLDEVSFEVKPNQKLAIISESSLTSNVLFCLITGLYDLEKGNISLDGIPTENLNKSLMREHIGTMLQQEQIVYTTIIENITMGRTSIPFQDVINLCHELGLTEYIEKCPEKYETMLNPEGHFIPLDVKTKLFLARVIIGLPRLILFENLGGGLSPSQVDLLAEKIKSINNRTIIMATHEPKFLEISDHILLFENGRIRFEGSYASYQKHLKSC